MKDFLIPQRRADGSVEFTSSAPFEIQRKLQEGDPSLGWEGDVFLCLWHDDRSGKESWYVMEFVPGSRPRVAIKLGETVIDDRVIIKVRDARNNAKDVLATLDRAEAHDAQVEQERRQQRVEQNQEMFTELGKALKKDGRL